MAGRSWAELDAVRKGLKKPLSRAEWCRRAGIAESTVTKGISNGRRPYKDVRQRAELVLEAVKIAIEGGVNPQ